MVSSTNNKTNNKYKILLVEDDANIRNLVSTILETSDYHVIVAQTCSMAESLYSSHLPDLIILDLGLPDKDGMCFLHEVRKDSLTPIIVLSARSDEKDKVDALDAGANDYVTKPFRVGGAFGKGSHRAPKQPPQLRFGKAPRRKVCAGRLGDRLRRASGVHRQAGGQTHTDRI